MRELALYIGGQRVDLDGDELILMNYTRDDLENPTAVKNSYSRQITLKGTENNNRLFGEMFRGDRRTVFVNDSTGIYFDPMRKTPFEIYDELSSIIESGYVRLDKVSMKGADISYSVTLYGGLGGFFYSLSYNEDGTKKTLGDMSYKGFVENDDRIATFVLDYGVLSAKYVDEAWEYMSYQSNPSSRDWTYHFWNIINFAPCYNGLPDGFDADKAVIPPKRYENVPSTGVKDGLTYTRRDNTSTNLLKFARKHTEWEVGDLRWYHQRPVVSIRSIIEACCHSANNGGYTVKLDEDYFNSDNYGYWDGWVTLQFIPKDERTDIFCIHNLLKKTATPADYLLSFAKMLGMVFLYDGPSKTVTIMSRNTFYHVDQDHLYPVLDLSQRIDVSGSIDIDPVVASAKYYQFGDSAIGEFADEYKDTYRIPYGVQRVNTGYDFDSQDSVLTDGVLFASAPDVLEFSRMFQFNNWGMDENGGYTEFLFLPEYEEVKVTLWRTTMDGGETKYENIEVSAERYPFNILLYFNETHPFADFFAKVQLHGEDNKPVDGANVFLIFNQMEAEVRPMRYPLSIDRFLLTDDHPDMEVLNQGTPCWNLATGISRRLFPSFRRFKTTRDNTRVLVSAEWGVPQAVGDPTIITENIPSLYDWWWRKYIQDLFDVDTKVLKCKADLRGLEVGQELLRRFWWYDGAIWVINRIVNHSLITDDLTELELIKVKDMMNYKAGQPIY